GAPGLEPGTSALSGPRSNHLSYAPAAGWAHRSAHPPRSAVPKTKQNQNTACHHAPSRSPRRPCRTGQPAPLAAPSRGSVPWVSAFTGCVLDRRDDFPRKEVIQPQLPLRLPCYDFVPITSPTLDSCALAVRPPASGVASFHD